MAADDEAAVAGDGEPKPEDANGSGKPSGDAPGANEASAGTASDAVDEATSEQVNQAAVIVNVRGDLYAEGASFGHQDQSRGRSRTGSVDDETLQESLRLFVDPPRLAEAQAVLLGRGVVVLAGEDGSGRRCAGLALLEGLPQLGDSRPRPVVLSPSMTIERLAEYRFQRHGRYLLADQIGDGTVAAQLSHDLARVRERIRDSTTEASLVITVRNKDRFGDLAVCWEPVAGEAILDAYLDATGVVLTGSELAELRECIGTLTPYQARRLLDRMEAEGTQAALRSKIDAAREDVSTWLSTDPLLHQLLPVVTAAFVHGATRRSADRCGVELRRAVDAHAGLDTPPATEVILPTRGNQSNLVHVRPPVDDPFGEPTVRFSDGEHHEALFRELVDRYGPQLWEPVHDWHLALPGICDGETRNNVAIGTAVFARVEPAEVRRILNAWADGTAAWRTTAAATLHWMCQDDSTSPLALAIAGGWCTGAGQRRAVTAALAFALDVGARYPGDSVGRLWQLAMRGQIVSRWAAIALAVLVHRSAEDGEDDRSLGESMRMVRKQLRHLLRTRPHDHRAIGLALGAVLIVLSSPGPVDDKSITVSILRGHPGLIPLLGELWAEVIASFAHRDYAIEHLRDMFADLDAERDADPVRALGDAVCDNLDPDQWIRLRRDLPEGNW